MKHLILRRRKTNIASDVADNETFGYSCTFHSEFNRIIYAIQSKIRNPYKKKLPTPEISEKHSTQSKRK